MYNFIPTCLLVVGISFTQIAIAQDIEGAWSRTYTNEDGVEITATAIVSGNYFSDCLYNVKERTFMGTAGGSWQMREKNLELSYEYHTLDSSKVGQRDIYAIELDNNSLTLNGDQQWRRIDDGSPGELEGAWLITGRERDGEMRRYQPGVRKTMKILSGTRFQWIAYNVETGGFFGTGGGTYSTIDGKYIENIEFFSRDGQRVGASLQFDFNRVDSEWHHKGLSSKGNPIYEIWTLRSALDQEK